MALEGGKLHTRTNLEIWSKPEEVTPANRVKSETIKRWRPLESLANKRGSQLNDFEEGQSCGQIIVDIKNIMRQIENVLSNPNGSQHPKVVTGQQFISMMKKVISASKDPASTPLQGYPN